MSTSVILTISLIRYARISPCGQRGPDNRDCTVVFNTFEEARHLKLDEQIHDLTLVDIMYSKGHTCSLRNVY